MLNCTKYHKFTYGKVKECSRKLDNSKLGLYSTPGLPLPLLPNLFVQIYSISSIGSRYDLVSRRGSLAFGVSLWRPTFGISSWQPRIWHLVGQLAFGISSWQPHIFHLVVAASHYFAYDISDFLSHLISQHIIKWFV